MEEPESTEGEMAFGAVGMATGSWALGEGVAAAQRAKEKLKGLHRGHTEDS